MKKIKKKKEKPTILFNVVVKMTDGEVEKFDDIVQIEPTATGLLVLTSISFKVTGIPFANIKKYDFEPRSQEKDNSTLRRIK